MGPAVRVSLVIMLIAASLGLSFPGQAQEAFTDVPSSHLFAGDITWLAAEGITRGCNPPDNTRFCPEDSVTRGQMAAFLVRTLDLPAGPQRFSDTSSSVFVNDINALAAAGVTRGCNPPDNTRFCPDQVVTRGQMAAFLTRALSLGSSGSQGFTDTGASVFVNDIDALAEAGITRGCNPPDNTRFCPDDPVTRGQMAAFLHRALAAPPLTITTTSLDEGVVGQTYSQSLTATGGTPPYTWQASGLPPGLSIDTAGTITGTPSAPGSFVAEVTVADSGSKTAIADLAISVVGVASVSAGTGHTCGLDEAGAAWCWGLGDDGRLGWDSTDSRDVPTPVVMPSGVVFVSITAGGEFTCALDSSAAAWCWGRNFYGQVGAGDNDNRLVPTAVAGGIEFQSLDAGTSHVCGLDLAGTVYCWGSNAFGELGRGTFDIDGSPTPGPADTTLNFASVSAGNLFTCAIATTGAGYCWGMNSDGRLGNGDSPNHSFVPDPIAVVSSFTSVVAGSGHACGIDSGGVTHCWGWNGSGQVGDGSSGNMRDTPVTVDSDQSFQAMGLGDSHTCGVDSDLALYCWGYNLDGQTGNGTPPVGSLTPAPVESPLRFASVAAGGSHTCGVDVDGLVHCWGLNADGQLGDGEAGTDRSTPTQVVGFP